jgi:hypothetical protein
VQRLTGFYSERLKSYSLQKQEEVMSEQAQVESNDSVVDARAIFAIIMLVVATAVFWVSNQ